MDVEDWAIEETFREKDLGEMDNQNHHKTPTMIKPVPRFYSCLTALWNFFKKDLSPLRSCRKSKFHFLVYGFVDALKSGLGSIKSWDDKTTVRMGTWGADTNTESSNWQELTNLVKDLEKEEETEDLDGSWIIIATDNSTAEGCLYKGNSPSKNCLSWSYA